MRTNQTGRTMRQASGLVGNLMLPPAGEEASLETEKNMGSGSISLQNREPKSPPDLSTFTNKQVMSFSRERAYIHTSILFHDFGTIICCYVLPRYFFICSFNAVVLFSNCVILYVKISAPRFDFIKCQLHKPQHVFNGVSYHKRGQEFYFNWQWQNQNLVTRSSAGEVDSCDNFHGDGRSYSVPLKEI